MRITTEALEHRQVKVIVELDEAEVEDRMRQTAREVSRKFNVPGYRRGKAPYAAVLRAFGREAIRQEMVDRFGQDLYKAALDQIEVEPFQQGELQEVLWDPFRMVVLLPIAPEVVLGDYWTLRRPLPLEPVTDEQVEAALRQIQSEHAQWVPVERPAAFGDQVVLDLVGKVDAQQVEKEEQAQLVLEEGATQPVLGFHEQIVGMSAGESKSFSLTYPEEASNKSAAGREVSFTVRLHTVKQQDLPPLDDELAMMVGDYDSLDGLRAAIRQRLEADALERAKPAYLDEMLTAIVDQAVKIDYPPQALDHEAEQSLDRIEANMSRSGIDLDRFLLQTGKTRESYLTSLRPMAEARLKKRLVMAEVAKQEGIKVADEEVDAELERLRSVFAGDERMRQMLEGPAARLTMAEDILMEKVQERILEIGRSSAPLASGMQQAEGTTQDDVALAGSIQDAAEAAGEEPALPVPPEGQETEEVRIGEVS